MFASTKTPVSNKDIEELKREYRKIRERYVVIATAAAAVLVGGAIVYHHLLHLTWVSAFYFCTVTLTTVGYGDIVPTTDTSRLFTIFYILIGIGIVANFVSLLIQQAGLKREMRKAKRKLRKSE